MRDEHVNYVFCQGVGCERWAIRGAEHWLDEPSRLDRVPDVRIMRCPWHWNVGALTNAIVGRSAAMLDLMAAAEDWARAQTSDMLPLPGDPLPYDDPDIGNPHNVVFMVISRFEGHECLSG